MLLSLETSLRGTRRGSRAFGRTALHDLGDLRDRFERLVLDRLRREPAQVRRRDDVGAGRDGGIGHLHLRAADVDGAAGEPARVERARESRFVDEVAARDVDEESAALHARERRVVHQVLRLGRRGREAHDVIRRREQLGQFHLLDPLPRGNAHVRVGDEHPHAEHRAQRCEAPADGAVADDAERAA